MSLSRAARQYMGVRAILPPDLQTATRNPTASDTAYVKGTLWLNTTSPAAFMWPGSGSWISLGTSSSGDITSLTGSSGGAIAPVAGNITLAAGTGMLSTAGTSGTITFNVNFAAPPALGSGTPAAVTGTTVTSTGAMTAGTGLTATTGNITASTGNLVSTLGSVSAATTVTAGTTVTATLGAITATNGNFVKGTAGNKDIYSSVATNATAGANSAGSVTLVGGTVTVETTSVTANSLIRLTRQSVGSTGANDLGILSVGTIVAGTSFVINAWTVTDATALQADDVSVVFWEIVN